MLQINITNCQIQNINCKVCCDDDPPKPAELVFIRVINDLETQAVFFDLMPTAVSMGSNIKIFEFDGTQTIPMWKINMSESNLMSISVPNMDLYWTLPQGCSCNDLTLEPLMGMDNPRQFFTMEAIQGTDLFYLKNMAGIYIGTTQMPVQPNTNLIKFVSGTGTFRAGFRFDQPMN